MYSKPERVKDSPRALTNSSGTGMVPLTANQARSAAAVVFHNGRHRSFGPCHGRARWPVAGIGDHLGGGRSVRRRVILLRSTGAAWRGRGCLSTGWVGCVQEGLHFLCCQMLDQLDSAFLAGIARIRRICSIAEGTRYSRKCMKDLMAASRMFRELGPLPRVVSRSFRKSSTSGASICSTVNWEGVTWRRLLAKVKSNWKVYA